MANTNANKYLGAGLGLLLLSFCFMAGAEDLTGTAWDLDTLQKQRVLYEAQAAVKKAQAEAEGVGGNISTGTLSSSTGEAGSGMRNTGNTVSATPDITPQLVKINGRNAVISMPGGKTITVNSGQMLPGGRWQVVSVSLNGVKVRNISTRREEILN
ncbi:type IV pilus biogenesis protein PilP [Salmonella enterica]|uniref:Type IV pilus biogenesis protein PilP n=1 Tax=Salmonella newport TaxID=108619 RepID=A0A5U9VVU1_SALNE|nr:type IV pilus biogenesis protein PilP [Salmonella enterica]EBR9623341.1 type IV pilus biogenesis protein PilP [Salmonella enterica subsp. enterica serovar Montevideo]EBS4548280.1 type IV pilus biogenesis protein PilP [Salmonella enterica subsp. enterica serovar Newport]EDR9714045.1 type IV pilus biogenesis protein PilP [Salmonella enterica subsp. diarizonae]EEH4118137.1 type IV pilus biogenesis protein PilP [Salmonella enterica subsp. enterica serovar Hvittingfoss]MJZ70896.1 type IV pilus b